MSAGDVMTIANRDVELSEISDQKPHPGRRMTEEEFVAWCDDKTRAEWVDGEVIIMSPANLQHVRLNQFLGAVLREFVESQAVGEVVGPEFQVRLASQRRRRVPDILFVATAHADRLRTTYLEGAPDMSIEIVSPDSDSRDWREKYLEYEKAGVSEYWVIDPLSQHVEAYTLTDQSYKRINEKNDQILSVVLPKFYLRPSWLWQQPLPKVRDVLRELGIA
jgi:Uma2 family endonuclease